MNSFCLISLLPFHDEQFDWAAPYINAELDHVLQKETPLRFET